MVLSDGGYSTGYSTGDSFIGGVCAKCCSDMLITSVLTVPEGWFLFLAYGCLSLVNTGSSSVDIFLLYL